MSENEYKYSMIEEDELEETDKELASIEGEDKEEEEESAE